MHNHSQPHRGDEHSERAGRELMAWHNNAAMWTIAVRHLGIRLEQVPEHLRYEVEKRLRPS